MFKLFTHQQDAVDKMHNGCILVGEVGTGKSRTALAYFVLKVCGGHVRKFGKGEYIELDHPMNLYVITTAKKRDTFEWFDDSLIFRLGPDQAKNIGGISMVVDSWNNIKKYRTIKDSFFIFDEQRLVGSGTWVKAFYEIAKHNQWILLSATPGDTWSDYIPVFVANGFYRNKTEFSRMHIVYSPFIKKYPKIDRYVNTKLLEKERDDILVEMKFEKRTRQQHLYLTTDYDRDLYKRIWRDRWDPYDNEPIQETGKLFYLMRRAVNGSLHRMARLRQLLREEHLKRVIIFYNFDYELNAIKELLEEEGMQYGQWNGHVHESVPDSNEWAYLVQYTAGSEGWNCVETNVMIFFSQTYSYRTMIQAAGRIDRMNTPYQELYYYHLISSAPIDIAIRRALRSKKNFNERNFLKE